MNRTLHDILFGNFFANIVVRNNRTEEIMPAPEEPEIIETEPTPVVVKVKKKWYNDGETNKMYPEGEQPEGWVLGKIKK